MSLTISYESKMFKVTFCVNSSMARVVSLFDHLIHDALKTNGEALPKLSQRKITVTHSTLAVKVTQSMA